MIKGWNKFESGLLLVSLIISLIVFRVTGDTLLGLLASISGVVCVILTAKGKLSCYGFGIINSLTYAIISYKAGLYGDAVLNAFYYLPMQFLGIIMWQKNMNKSTDEVEGRKMTLAEGIIWLTITIAFIFVGGYLLQFIKGKTPFIDATTTTLSIIAMILSVKRYAEQWIIWIVIDIVSVYMWVIAYINNAPNSLTMIIMWVAFLINAVYGYVKWVQLSKIDSTVEY